MRLKPKPGAPKHGAKADGWLLIKERDIFVQPEADGDITEDAPNSVATGRSIETDRRRRACQDAAAQEEESGGSRDREREGGQHARRAEAATRKR